MIKKLKLIFTLLLFSFCFVSCDKEEDLENQHELVGTWVRSQNYVDYDDSPFVITSTFTFNSDFSGGINFSYSGTYDGKEWEDDDASFTWFAENGYISIDSDYEVDGNNTYEDTEGFYEIDENELSLTLEYEGTGTFDTEVYTRVE